MELAGLRHDVAFVKEQFSVSEPQACKLFAVDRSTYRYEPRPDRNAQLRGEIMALARQKPAIRVPKIARHSDSAWLGYERHAAVSPLQ